ncbi:MAG: hypothetical protein GXY86_05255 [Firmicutes bacterium]|nr:hypothetical protein [Bacillota bacterium]
MKYLVYVMLAFFVLISMVPTTSAETVGVEDFHPIQADMRITFKYIVGHIIKDDNPWNLSVVKSSFPESLTYTWVRPQDEEEDLTGTRILTDLKYSRSFNPWYKTNESKATNDTAPWISQAVLQELREKGTAANFREGGLGALNWVAKSLEVEERLVFPLMINGKPEAIHALKLNRGLIVWNNMNNPLVLEYEPLAVPLLTSITGWKVKEINY